MKRLFVLFILVGLCLMVLTTMAQEVTPVPTIEVTPLPRGWITPDAAVNLIQLIGYIASGVILGGGLTLAAVLALLNRVRNDKAVLTAIEGLTSSYPPETREFLRGISAGLRDLSEIIKEVTDETPVSQKP